MTFHNLTWVAGQASSGGDWRQLIFMMALIVVVFYFIVLRPQQREKQERQKMLNAVKPDDKVITIGGIHGRIKEIKESKGTVVLEVAKNVLVEFNRSAILNARVKDDEKPTKDQKESSK